MPPKTRLTNGAGPPEPAQPTTGVLNDSPDFEHRVGFVFDLQGEEQTFYNENNDDPRVVERFKDYAIGYKLSELDEDNPNTCMSN
tara:strand:- start:2599 stop:2853 length:255 start_codon:yes stop_codon:yes gene_type:complete